MSEGRRAEGFVLVYGVAVETETLAADDVTNQKDVDPSPPSSRSL